jgi:hypothetical protein
MATLNQMHLPDELLLAIQRRAQARGVTVEEQIVRDLEVAEVINGGSDEQALLAEIRRERQVMASKGVYLTEEFLRQAKKWGRE